MINLDSIDIVDYINEHSVWQGNLVFIFHHKKPTKSGWWRKIKGLMGNEEDVFYILEKSMNKNFNFNIESKNCRTNNGFCIMKSSTIRYDEKYKDKHTYEILANVSGTMSIKLIKENYNMGTILQDLNDVDITKNYIELYKSYLALQGQKNELISLAENLI